MSLSITPSSITPPAARPAAQPGPTRLELLAAMLRIRAYEEKIVAFHAAGPFPNVCTSVGQEASAVGVVAALRAEDQILTNHRSAGHLLARGADPGRMLAEVMGRSDGYCQGSSGTLHISVKELGVVLTSTIVGGELSLAPGVALSRAMLGGEGIVVCFFGDGAACEGIFHESLNLAVGLEPARALRLREQPVAGLRPPEGDHAGRPRRPLGGALRHRQPHRRRQRRRGRAQAPPCTPRPRSARRAGPSSWRPGPTASAATSSPTTSPTWTPPSSTPGRRGTRSAAWRPRLLADGELTTAELEALHAEARARHRRGRRRLRRRLALARSFASSPPTSTPEEPTP